MRIPARPLTVVLLVALAACDATSEGRRLYEAGRFEDARAAFAKAAESRASASVLFDEALAALASGAFSDAESAAKKAAAADPQIAPLCEFLGGNVSFARCELAEKQADTVEAEPFAYDAAIAFGESARAHWLAAAATRAEWPVARRNVERAALKIEELRRKKADAASPQKKKASAPNALPTPKPSKEKKPNEDATKSATDASKDAGNPDKADATVVDLTPEQLAALFDALAAKEKEKLALRRATRKAAGAEVEKDW